MNFSGFKSGYPIALRSAAAITGFWFLLFLVLSIARSLAQPYLSVLGQASDASTPALATTLLQLGLGGTLVAGGAIGETAATFSVAFLLLIIPIGMFYLIRAVNRRYPASASTEVQAGAYAAFGSALTIAVLAFLSSGTTALGAVSSSVGFAWIVSAVVAAFIGYTAIPGAVKNSILGQFIPAGRAFGGAFRGLSKLLVVIAVVAACYAALRMGTSLNPSAPLWYWPLAAVAFAIVLPTASALLAPLFLGALVAFTSSATLAVSPQAITNPLEAIRQTDYAWVSWAIFGVAWLSVIFAAVRNAYRNGSDKKLWLQLPIVNIVVALLLAWLGSFRVSGSSTLLSFLAAAPSVGNEGFTTAGVFAVAGLVYGLVAHPAFRPVTVVLNQKVGGALNGVLQAVLFVVALRWVGPLNALKAKLAAQRFVVRKAVKYSLVFSLVGLSFLAGAPLASVTAPLYDSENYADGALVKALRTGDAKSLVKIASSDGMTFLTSAGLGDSATIELTDPQEVQYLKDVAAADKAYAAAVKAAKGKSVKRTEVEKPGDEHLRNITWGDKGKYFLNLKYSLSYSKAPFLTVVPQWDVAILKSSLPKLTMMNGKAELHVIQVGKKSYQLSDVVILPGLAQVTAGVDNTGFLTSNNVMVDLTKDAKADLKITLNASKGKELADYFATKMRAEFTGCTTLTYKSGGDAKLGAVDLATGLPTLQVSGSGVCDSTDSGKIPYNVHAVGTYSVDSSEWKFSYKF